MLRRIGFVDLATGAQRANVHPDVADHLRRWAESYGFASVVWTDLPSNFDADQRGPFTVDAVVAYLRALPALGAQRAKEYISRARQDVVTPLRTAVTDAAWWGDYGDPSDPLEAEITATNDFLQVLTARPGRRGIDHALARYLWFGTQTAAVIDLACGAGHPAGTATLRRYLFETLLDIHMLVSSDTPDLDAAKTMAWDVVDWDRRWDLHEEAVDVDPDLDTGHAQTESMDEALQSLRDELESLGEDLELFDQAATAARAAPRGQWHWSGFGPTGRMKELERRAGNDHEALQVVAMYRGIWKILSSSAHPSPAWQRLKIDEHASGTFDFPDSATGGDLSAERVENTTANWLRMCRGLITLYREMDEAEEG